MGERYPMESYCGYWWEVKSGTKYMRPKFKKLSCSRMELLLLGKFYPFQTINIVKNVTKLVKWHTWGLRQWGSRRVASRAPSWCWWGDGVCSDGLSMSLSYWYVMAIHCFGGIMEMRKGGVGEDSPRIQNLSCLFVCSWLWRIIFPSANFVTLRTWQ